MNRYSQSFIDLGVQYYIAARWSAKAQLNPVCANLFHHAIEMFLKARLASVRQSADLKNLGHNLNRLWSEFKKEFPNETLDEFDEVISGLHRYERIRYPDAIMKEGMMSMIDWVQPSTANAGAKHTKAPPQYSLLVSEIDRLIVRIFVLIPASTYAFSVGLSQIAQEFLTLDNQFAAGWTDRPEQHSRP